MDVIDIDDATEQEEAAEGGQQQAQPPASQAPSIDPDALARRIVSQLQMGQQQSAQKSAMQTAVADMLAKGYDPSAVQSILGVLVANEQDKAAHSQEAATRQYFENYNRKCWEMADEALGRFEVALPAVADDEIRAALLQKTNKIFQSDPEFAAERERALSGELPSKRSINAAASKAIGAYCKANGISNTPAPLDVKSSKPEPVAAKASDPYDGLTEAERKRAKAVGSALKLSPQEAAKRVRADRRSA